jgi:AcrR family transcriptional regulator
MPSWNRPSDEGPTGMTADEAPAVSRRQLAVARALDQTRSRAEFRVKLFLDAARELVNTESGEFTVQEVVERSGQSLRTFYQYFEGKHDLLLALFEESISATAQHLADVVAQVDGPLERLHAFTTEYYAMCRITRRGRSRAGPPPAMVRFAQELLTARPGEATRAFAPLVAMLEELLADAAVGGAIRPGLDHTRIAGVVLQATMFNRFATVISGSSDRSGADEPELLWELLLHGMVQI